MIAPEQWYEYQRQYQKYGIDMQPEVGKAARKKKREKQKKARLSRGIVLRVNNDHKNLLTSIIVCTIMALLFIVSSSYAAKITYDINTIKAQNDVISGEIENLDVQMLSSNTITYLEGQARGKLGMKSPGSNNCVYISSQDVPQQGFADILKEKAYN